MWTACPPSETTGKTSDRRELPTITNSSALMPRRSKTRLYVSTSFSLRISTPRNISPSPDRASLLSWSNRSPLVMSSRSYRPPSPRSVSSTPSRSLVGSMSMRQLDRCLDHGESERLHAVAVDAEILHLHLGQPRVDVRVGHMALEEIAEFALGDVKARLAVPQRLVPVERPH